jgi:CheY-like chemotaxis protein
LTLFYRDSGKLRFFAIKPPQLFFRISRIRMQSPDSIPPLATPGRGALILVVERNPVVQRLERYFLEQAGFSVEFIADGVTALARARELRPKIIVTEILVPKLDGLSLCRANILLLRFREGAEMERTLRIIKTRGSAHNNREHKLEITSKGIVINKK